MTDRCEPPPEWRYEPYHWVDNQGAPIVGRYISGMWYGFGRVRTPEKNAAMGIKYLRPCRTDDATERLRLEAENARLRDLIQAILAADERGQGLPFADAMDAAQEAVYGKRT